MPTLTGKLRPGFAALLPGWTLDGRRRLGERLDRLEAFVRAEGGAVCLAERLELKWMAAREDQLPRARRQRQEEAP